VTLACGECGAGVAPGESRCPVCDALMVGAAGAAPARRGAPAVRGAPPLGVRRVGLVAFGTLGYGVTLVIALWLYHADYVAWTTARRILGGLLAIVGVAIIGETMRAWGRRTGRPPR